MEEELRKLQSQIACLQQQLEQQSKMAELGFLSAGIAHEVQNPLNFVINFSQLSAKLLDTMDEVVQEIQEKPTADALEDLQSLAKMLRENLSKITEHGHRASSVARNVLLLSRGKAGEKLPTDVNQLVQEYVRLAYHSMRAKDHRFNIRLQENYQQEMPKCMLVTQDISRVVLNLVNNAFYAVCEQAALTTDATYTPTIQIETRINDFKQLCISIGDNGTGMTSEVQEKLFKTVFTTKPVGKGTGLGLGIVHRIVCEEHGGQIQVESAVGKGTTFFILLPLVAAHE